MLRSYDLSELNNSSLIQKDQKQQEQKFVIALRYATGLFRFLYTFIISISAFFLFRHADFWPVYLGGKIGSSTANCWDLSGGIALTGVDQDFDQFNSTLRYYFVVQASYQIQSLFFHCFLFILSNTWKLKKSWKDFLRSFSEHIIGLFLLTGSFLFSSWRRLGAVGMFALDASGLFLHLLQITLNAASINKTESSFNGQRNNILHRNENEENFLLNMPDAKFIGRTPKIAMKEKIKGKQIRRNIVWFVHRFLVVPSFMYCRLFVFPFIIWYSAAFESHEWLKQMEHAFVPGWGNVVFYFFNILLMIIMTLNLVLFQRLLFHPHVTQVLKFVE